MKNSTPFYEHYGGESDDPWFEINCRDFHFSMGNDWNDVIIPCIGCSRPDWQKDDDDSIAGSEDTSTFAGTDDTSTCAGTDDTSTVESSIAEDVRKHSDKKSDKKPDNRRQKVQVYVENRQDIVGIRQDIVGIENLRTEPDAQSPTKRQGNDETAIRLDKVPTINVDKTTSRTTQAASSPIINVDKTTSRRPHSIPEVKPSLSCCSPQPTSTHKVKKSSFYSARSGRSNFSSASSKGTQTTARSIGLKKQGRSSKGTTKKSR